MERIDSFIDAGIEAERATGNKFEYKKTLKKTYKYLKTQGIDIPKEIKKDINELVIHRIAKRHPAPSKYIAKSVRDPDGSFTNETLERYQNEEPSCNDSMRGSVVGFCVGAGMVCTRNPTAVKIGIALMATEGWALYDETKAYLSQYWDSDISNSRERSEVNCNGRRNERKRDMTRD